jgi:hypothetical protein
LCGPALVAGVARRRTGLPGGPAPAGHSPSQPNLWEVGACWAAASRGHFLPPSDGTLGSAWQTGRGGPGALAGEA